MVYPRYVQLVFRLSLLLLRKHTKVMSWCYFVLKAKPIHISEANNQASHMGASIIESKRKIQENYALYFTLIPILKHIWIHFKPQFPIATLWYILLSVSLSLAFALMIWQSKDNTVWNLIQEKGELPAKKPLFARHPEDFNNFLQ